MEEKKKSFLSKTLTFLTRSFMLFIYGLLIGAVVMYFFAKPKGNLVPKQDYVERSVYKQQETNCQQLTKTKDSIEVRMTELTVYNNNQTDSIGELNKKIAGMKQDIEQYKKIALQVKSNIKNSNDETLKLIDNLLKK